ncbi:MAG: hypothetical protein AAGL69_09390 [Pseudomonadota bacterium]
MIATILSTLIVFGVLKALPATKEIGGDVAITAVVGPAIMIFLVGVLVGTFGLPLAVSFLSLFLYFVVPFFWLKVGLNQPSSVAALVGGVVLIVAVVVQYGFAALAL